MNKTPEITPGTVTIEHAIPDDVEAICEIRDAAWLDSYPNEELGITRDDVKLIAQGPDGIYVPRRVAFLKQAIAEENETDGTIFVAKLDGDIKGFAAPRIEDGKKMVSMMYVMPGSQGRGLGGKLMSRLLEYYGDDEDIYLEVASYNDRAIRFYEKYGFVRMDNPVPIEENRPDYLKVIPQIEMVRRRKG